MSKVLAICLKTYPDEDDMQRYCDGEIAPHEVKMNFKGTRHLVNPDHYDPEYFEIIDGESKKVPRLDYKELERRLLVEVKKRGYSQEGAAYEMGFKTRMLFENIKKGKDPRTSSLIKMMTWLGIYDISEIITTD